MIPVTTRYGQKIALFGLGGSGLVTAQALVDGGAQLTAFDDNPVQVEKANAMGIPTGDLHAFDFSDAHALVLAPGVPLTHPEPHWTVKLAQEAGTPVIGDISLFNDERQAQAPESSFVAITGTNGKSTTTALISHIIGSSGRDIQMGGNIGRAALTLDTPSKDRFYVIECSSYQIDLVETLCSDVGILLNLAPDHLERHGTMENYAGIKERLVAQSKHAIVGVDDDYCAAIAKRLSDNGHKVLPISSHKALEHGVYVKDRNLMFAEQSGARQIASLEGIPTLRGIHNAQNAAAAWAACHLLGLDDDEIQSGLNTFGGLAHRMEILGHIGPVVVVNDSKATNADAAAMALGSFENIYWIAGGLRKEGGIEVLRPFFGKIRKAYLIGEAAPAFAATLGGNVAFEISETLENATASAATDSAGKDGAILLSPACASFDQFSNFEIRGEAFRHAVEELEGFKPFIGGNDAE